MEHFFLKSPCSAFYIVDKLLAAFSNHNTNLFGSLHGVKNSSVVQELYTLAVLGKTVTLDETVGYKTINELAHQGLIAVKPTFDRYTIDFPALYLMYLSANSCSTFLPKTQLVSTPQQSLSPQEAEIMDCNTMLLKLQQLALKKIEKVELDELLDIKNKSDASKVELIVPPPTDQAYVLVHSNNSFQFLGRYEPKLQ